MANNLGLVEEFDIVREITIPHLLYADSLSIIVKKKVAYLIMIRRVEEVLLVNSPGFCISAIMAGLSEKHIEHIAKSGPDEYKQEILNTISTTHRVKEILEIAQAMDEDLGRGVTQNQERVKNVVQYIKDNRVAFEF